MTRAMNVLRRKAAVYTRAQQRRDAAMTELLEALRAADAEGGHTRNELVAVSGLARTTVWDALRAARPATVYADGGEIAR